MRLPRLQPPPPLCDCCRPPTRIERMIWAIRAWWQRFWYYLFPRKQFKIKFDHITTPIITGQVANFHQDMREILTRHSLKDKIK